MSSSQTLNLFLHFYGVRSVVSIGDTAFGDDKLILTVFMPTSVTYLSPTAFPNTTLIIYGTQSPTFAPADTAVVTVLLSGMVYCIFVFLLLIGLVSWGLLGRLFLSTSSQTVLVALFVSLYRSVTFLGRDVFADGTALRNVTLPTSLVVIQYGSFFRCALRTVIIPTSITFIEASAFA
eukprot:gene29252-38756_t